MTFKQGLYLHSKLGVERARGKTRVQLFFTVKADTGAGVFGLNNTAKVLLRFVFFFVCVLFFFPPASSNFYFIRNRLWKVSFPFFFFFILPQMISTE